MTHELRVLRERYVSLSLRTTALSKAMKARREMAQRLAIELEAAALAGLDEKVRTLMEDLQALDNAYRESERAFEELLDEEKKVWEEIWAFYDRAYEVDEVKVDWNLVLEEGYLYNGWTQANSKGQIALIKGAELSRPEMEYLRKKVFPAYVVHMQGERLRVIKPIYRDTVWADVEGEEIVQALLPILPSSQRVESVRDFMRGLRVLE